MRALQSHSTLHPSSASGVLQPSRRLFQWNETKPSLPHGLDHEFRDLDHLVLVSISQRSLISGNAVVQQDDTSAVKPIDSLFKPTTEVIERNLVCIPHS